jgi:hypothetical protein
MATLVVAMSGCDDLGAFENTNEYYNSFGEIALISGTAEDKSDYDRCSVEQSFYNEKSREDFLAGEDDIYKRVAYSDYVYMAIPLKSTLEMDTLALFIKSETDATVYINVYVTDKIPTEWKAIEDNVINSEEAGESPDEEMGEETEKVYDDPDPESRIGEVAVHLKSGKWNSFVLDAFKINGKIQESIQINDGQYILLQIRNNSGVRVFNEEKQSFVDPQTGLELQKAEITMTNLLIRALNINNESEAQGGE